MTFDALPMEMAADRRRSAVAGLGVAVIVGILGVGAWFTGRAVPPEPPPAPPPDSRDVEERERQDDLAAPGEVESRAPEPVAATKSEALDLAAFSVPAIESETEPPPPGTLEILVTLDGEPRTSGLVVLDAVGPARGGVPDAELRPSGSHLGHERHLDERGIASFAGVEPGRWWVAVSLEEGHLAQRICDVPEESGARVTVALTSSRVFGTVYDDEGNGVSDAWVALSPLVGREHWQVARSDSTGAYEFPFAQPGPTWIVHYPGKRFGAGRSSHPMERIGVPNEGELRHDFGTSAGLATFSGRLLTRSGDPVLDRTTLHLTEVESGGYVAVSPAGETGTFSRALRPGRWKIEVDDPLTLAQRVEVGEIEVTTADLTRDVTLPGTRIVAHIAGVRESDRTWLGVRSEPSGGGPVWTGTYAGDDRWIVDGVMPGAWFLTANAHGGWKADAVAVTVAESDVFLEVELELVER